MLRFAGVTGPKVAWAFVLTAAFGECARGAPAGRVVPPAGGSVVVAPAGRAVPSSAGGSVAVAPRSGEGPAVGDARGGAMVRGYFAFEAPSAWAVTSRPLTLGSPRYALPRATAGEPPVPLEEGFVGATGRADLPAGGDVLAEVLERWRTRAGAIAVERRAQALELRGEGAAERLGEVPVAFAERAANGRAFLGAAVDLSSVDARTSSADLRALALTFVLEGPEATVLAARGDFRALVRGVHLTR